MKFGECDFSQFKKMVENFASVVNDPTPIDEVLARILLDMGNISLAEVKERTPVDTGYLRRHWFISKVERVGDNFHIELYNTVEYASYVDKGHRTRLGTGASEPRNGGTPWVEGVFMVETSLKIAEQKLPAIANKHQKKFLKELLSIG